MWILATFVRKKHSLRWRQPKLSSSFVRDVSKRFAEAALRHPSSSLPPERVASLNFSWCKTSDCHRTSAIGSFKVELRTVFRENTKYWLIKVNFPSSGFWTEKIITHIIVEVIYFQNLKIKLKKNCSSVLPWKSVCLPSKSWGNARLRFLQQ